MLPLSAILTGVSWMRRRRAAPSPGDDGEEMLSGSRLVERAGPARAPGVVVRLQGGFGDRLDERVAGAHEVVPLRGERRLDADDEGVLEEPTVEDRFGHVPGDEFGEEGDLGRSLLDEVGEGEGVAAGRPAIAALPQQVQRLRLGLGAEDLAERVA